MNELSNGKTYVYKLRDYEKEFFEKCPPFTALFTPGAERFMRDLFILHQTRPDHVVEGDSQ